MNALELILFAITVATAAWWCGYKLGWTMRGEQEAIYAENDIERKASMSRHPAGKQLRVVRPREPREE